ncbi:MAG: BPL-N domain-containing protein [Humidesulfovibrio sp.]|nr:BPL-N domain-containing protein [Humidesulfovibrio sp.]
MTRVFVVWDDSHLWGLLVLRFLRALNVPHGILRALDIAEGALSGKSGQPGADAPALLIAPGGWARGRALRLGGAGLSAIREFVAGGGNYLGFCGGAGLALTSARPGESLGLCPWGRMGFAGRLQHFLSGDVRLGLAEASALIPPGPSELLAQVWWPAQFAPSANADDGVEVLARYADLGPDFWVADLALSRFPEETLSDWENLYGLQVRPDFLAGRPAVVSGRYGQGRYVLSYPHLETPDSPEANHWLTHILCELAAEDCPETATVPPWRVGADEVLWDDPALLAAKAALEKAITLGQDHLLLFWRNPWLLGWRRGVPGPGINSVYALICEALASRPTGAALDYWRGHAEEFSGLARIFCQGLSGLLLAERLDMTVRQTPGVDGADDVFAKNLREMRAALFGPPPAAGGVCGQLLGLLEELCAGLWKR